MESSTTKSIVNSIGKFIFVLVLFVLSFGSWIFYGEKIAKSIKNDNSVYAYTYEKEYGATDRFYGYLEKHPDPRYTYRIKGTNVRIITSRNLLGKYVTIDVAYTGVGDNFNITRWYVDDTKPVGYVESNNYTFSGVINDYEFEAIVKHNDSDNVYRLKKNNGDGVDLSLNETLSNKVKNKNIEIQVIINEK